MIGLRFFQKYTIQSISSANYINGKILLSAARLLFGGN
jgi:hypothetical protein